MVRHDCIVERSHGQPEEHRLAVEVGQLPSALLERLRPHGLPVDRAAVQQGSDVVAPREVQGIVGTRRHELRD